MPKRKISIENPGALYRNLQIRKDDIDEEKRTVEFSFSSETPVARYFGNEVLDHSETAVDLARLNSKGPLLNNHNPNEQRGVIERAWLDGKRGMVKVRFGKSDLADELFRDVLDGIKVNVSVGYDVKKILLEEAIEDGLDTYRVTEWVPYEVSFVSMPADTSVGVGRSLETEKLILQRGKEMPKPKTEVENKEIKPVVTASAAPAFDQEKFISDQKERTKEVMALGKAHGESDMALQAIQDGTSLNDFRSALLDKKQTKNKPAQVEVDPKIGMDENQLRKYSLFKAIRAAASGDWKDAKLEKECSLAVAEKMGKDARGFFMPFDVMADPNFKRAAAPSLNNDTANAGELVGTDHLAGSFVDELRNNSVVMQLGARTLPGLVGNVDIPKQNAGAAFGWIAEGADAGLTEMDFATVALTPKTVAGGVQMTRRLLKQSAPSIEMLVRQDLILGAALAIDLAALKGTGAGGQPMGILTHPDVLTAIAADITDPTWKEAVAMESALNTANSLMGNLAYVMSPAARGNMKTSAKDGGSGLFVMENNMVNGFSGVGTSQLAAIDPVIFGNFADILIGMWGVLDLEVDKATLAASGGLVLRTFQDIDINFRHAESFVKLAVAAAMKAKK